MKRLIMATVLMAGTAWAIEVKTDWPSYLGANGAFSETSGAKLVNDLSKIRFLWESEERGIGFGKALSTAARDGFAEGTGLAYGGEASPIVAGGLVIQFYTVPSGDATWSDGAKLMGEKYPQYEGFWKVSADEVVIAMDAATGKTRWKQVFADKGLNGLPTKRGGFAVTPCAADGKVYCMGTTGRLYCLDQATGKPVWESHIGQQHTALEAYKTDGLKTRLRPETPVVVRPYGMLQVVDGVLLAPDWAGGLLGVDAATGQRRWQTPACLSGFNCPVPVAVQGKRFIACVNDTGELRLIAPATGTVLWTRALGSEHLSQPVFGEECLMVFESHPKYTGALVGKGASPNALGVLAAYRLTEQGAEKAWSLPADFVEHLYLDGGSSRKIVARQGIVYCSIQKVEGDGTDPNDVTLRLAIVREKDGQLLGAPEVGGWNPYLWGDRLITVTDIQHRPRAVNPEIWQMYNADPADFRALGDRWYINGPKPAHIGTCGYEVPVLESFADGLLFCRVWGGIRCYDLRALTPEDNALPTGDTPIDPDNATWEVTLKAFFDRHRALNMVVNRKNGQWAACEVTARSWNMAWHAADLSHLEVKDGRLTGQIVITLRPDQWVPVDHGTNVVKVALDAALTGRTLSGTFTGNFGGDGAEVVGKVRKLEE